MDKSKIKKLPKGFDEETLKRAVVRVQNYERVEDIALEIGKHKKTLSAAIRSYTGVKQIGDLHTAPRPVDPRYKAAAEMVSQGSSLQQVADHFGVSKQVVSSRWLPKVGITESPRPQVLAAKKAQAIDELKKGKQPAEVMASTGLSKTAVKNLYRELKLPRERKAAVKLPQYEKAVADLRAGMSCADVSRKHKVAYITAVRWSREVVAQTKAAGDTNIPALIKK